MKKEYLDLYTNRDPRNWIVDGESRALYWISYRECYDWYRRILTPGAEIPLGIPILITGNSKLNPFHFDLRRSDKAPIGDFAIPGKSAHIAFDENPHVVIGAIHDRPVKRQDRVYMLPRWELIRETGYVVFYTPLPNQPLHVRIVHEVHLEDPSIEHAPFWAKTRLAEIFQEHCISHDNSECVD